MLLTGLLAGCGDEEVENNGFAVTGVVMRNNQPVENAEVVIDSIHNWSTVTANDGSFRINNVTVGTHSNEKKASLRI